MSLNLGGLNVFAEICLFKDPKVRVKLWLINPDMVLPFEANDHSGFCCHPTSLLYMNYLHLT